MSSTTASSLTNLRVLIITVNLWSGRAALVKTDLNPQAADNLPPEALASLGSKKLIDPVHLKPLLAWKNRLRTHLDSHYGRFLSGHLLSDSQQQELEQELSSYESEFNTLRTELLQDYSANVEQWADQFPEYRSVILQAAPSAGQLAAKINFDWSIFSLTPQGQQANAQVAALPDKILNDIHGDIISVRDRTFAKRSSEATSSSTFNSVRQLAGKVRGLTFIRPECAVLADCLTQLADLQPEASDAADYLTYLAGHITAYDGGGVPDFSQVLPPDSYRALHDSYRTQPQPQPQLQHIDNVVGPLPTNSSSVDPRIITSARPVAEPVIQAKPESAGESGNSRQSKNIDDEIFDLMSMFE